MFCYSIVIFCQGDNLLEMWKPAFWEKTPNGIMDGLLNNKESEFCFSCIWNIYWASSSSLPNIKATHRKIKVTYSFERKVNQKVNLGRRPTPTRPPGHRYFKGWIFKDPSNKKNVSKCRLLNYVYLACLALNLFYLTSVERFKICHINMTWDFILYMH